ncbi:hypothetical protein AB0B07_33300 [Streptomyces sioyaensis]|uniref:hypothetical protein n=1 Tax=Streptomyces sioyaensis TaxID=67364 RepID=UPI00340CA681
MPEKPKRLFLEEVLIFTAIAAISGILFALIFGQQAPLWQVLILVGVTLGVAEAASAAWVRWRHNRPESKGAGR